MAFAPSVSVQTVLDKKTSKWVDVVNAWIRDYPELMYAGLYLPNYFKDGGKWKKELNYAEQKAISYKNIGSLEADMTINANEVVHYEAGLILEEAEITAAVAVADDTLEVQADKIKFFKVV